MRYLALAGIRIDRHGSELHDPERAVARAHPDLAEEHGTGGVELDRDRHQGEHRREQEQAGQRHGEVHRPLQQPRRARKPYRRDADQREPLDVVDDRVRPDDLEEARHDVDLDVQLVEVADELQQVVLRVARERDDDTLDVERPNEPRELPGAAEHGHGGQAVRRVTAGRCPRSRAG